MLYSDEITPKDNFKYRIFKPIKEPRISDKINISVEQNLRRILYNFKDHPCCARMLEFILNDYYHDEAITNECVGLGIASDGVSLSFIERKDVANINDIEKRFKAAPGALFKKIFGDKMATATELDFFTYIFKNHI